MSVSRRCDRAPWTAARAAAAITVLGVLLAAATGCSSGHAARGDSLLVLPVPDHVTVTTRHVAGLGTVLADGRGHVLYMFPPDAGSRVSCTGTCAGIWPPLVIVDGNKPRAGHGTNPEDLSTIADPNSGARVVTYSGYPLYRYSSDVSSGTAHGQALFNNGGPWYVLDPNGQPVTTDPESGQ